MPRRAGKPAECGAMKTIVSDQHLPEGDIKPAYQMGEFRAKLDADFRRFLSSGISLSACACPGCQSTEASTAFEKSGLTYLECLQCASVYASPRPSPDALEEFYRSSDAVVYWHDVILPDTRAARLAKIIAPRARWVLRTADRYLPEGKTIVDIGQHSSLLVGELLSSRAPHCSVTAAGFLADLDTGFVPCRELNVEPTSLTELSRHAPVDFVLAFDVIDRAADLDELMNGAASVLGPSGLMLAGSTLISGFDLQTLWGDSESIYPPERLNLLSVDGVVKLCARTGFEILEFSTPGVFDAEIVKRAVQADPSAPWPRFLKHLITRCDAEVLDGFQEFLQKYRLSSFARLALRKL